MPADVLPATKLLGGIIGAGDLSHRYLTYRNLADFVADQPRHLNEPAWFEAPVLYGFVFSNVTVLPYHRYPGWMRFFEVNDDKDKRASSAPAGSP